WKNETQTAQGFLDLALDRGFDDYFASVNKIVSLHNFLYADRLGNIAYWSAGARPVFPAGFDDRLPADGTGSQEWSTFPDGSRYAVRAAPTFLIPAIQSAYANLKSANSPLVDATTHPSLETAVTVLGEWLAYLGDPSQIYPGGGHYAAAYSPSRGQPGMSI